MPSHTLPRFAALALGLSAAAMTPGQTHAGTGDAVVADFGTAEYFPNLKSKFGVASNAKREEMLDSIAELEKLAPGLVCSNLEFDYWYKWAGEQVPMLDLQYEIPGDPTSRPVSMADRPAPYMAALEEAIRGVDTSMLIQLTGAPPQFQPTTGWEHDYHPAPTEPVAAARLMAAWTSEGRHRLPILWSLWNEPGHSLSSEGTATAPDTSSTVSKKAQKRAAKKEAREKARDDRKNGKIGVTPLEAERSENAITIADLFETYSAAMRQTIGPWAGFGLSSFISADFNPKRGVSNGRLFFEEVMAGLQPGIPIDYLTFNSFNGAWSVIINGTRAVLGTEADRGPMIFTQFAPASLKFNPDGTSARENRKDSSPTGIAIDTLEDYIGLTRATDVQHVCMSYWVGGTGAFLDSRSGDLEPTARYHAMSLYMQVPVLRSRLEFAGTDLRDRGVGGVAGLNQAKAAVLLWNGGKKPVRLPLEVRNLSGVMQGGRAQVTLLDDDTATPQPKAYDGGDIVLPAHSMVLVEWLAPGRDDPLLRRNALDGPQGEAVFLQARSTPSRMAVACTDDKAIEGIAGCTGITGTFGAFDSVRSAAWLGMGQGGGPAVVRAVYENLPARLWASVGFAAVGQAPAPGAVAITASFADCGARVEATESDADPALLVMDFASVPPSCRAGAAVLDMTMQDVPKGTQAEVYLSADSATALALAETSIPLLRAKAPDVSEGLRVVKPRQDLGD